MNEVSQHANMGGLDVFCEIWNIRPQKSSLRDAESGFVLDLTGSFALRVQDDSVKGDPGINPG